MAFTEEWAEDTHKSRRRFRRFQQLCGMMSDCSEEDIFQYQSLKKRRIGDDDAPYEPPSSSRGSQKIKKKKKRKMSNGKLKPLQIENGEENAAKAESTQGPECMEFCPMCQMPLKIAIGPPDLHVLKCVGDFEKCSFEGECPLGLKCDITIRQHYQRYSHHLLSELRAGLNAKGPQSLSSRESHTGPKVMDSCQSPTAVSIHSSSLVTLEQSSLETKEETKPDTPLQDLDSDLSDSPSVLTDLPKECWNEHVVSSDPVHPTSTRDNSLSSDSDMSVELSPRRRMARKTFPYSPRQFQPEKVVCLWDPSREVNSSEAPASLVEGVSSKPSKIDNSVENLDERSHNLENSVNDSGRTVNARMSCADSSPLDPNSTVSFCQKLSAHQTSTPKSVKPRNVARKSVKGKTYLSIEDVRNSQRLASKDYFSSDKTSQDVKQNNHRQKLNFIEHKDAETKGSTEKKINESEDEVSDQDGGFGRKVEKSSPQRTSSPNLFDFGCEEASDDWDEIDLVSQKSEAFDVENGKREPSSQGNSQCNKTTVQSQIDRYFISSKTSSQESIASIPKTVNTDSQSTQSKEGNSRTKSSWKDIFKFSQGTKFSSTEKVSQSQSTNSTTTGSQGSSGSSVSAGAYSGQSGSTVSAGGYHRQSGVGRRQGGGSMWSKNQKKQCPFYKKMPGTTFAVDAFSYGDIPDITCYFLTHFHSDHYGGLTKKFTNPIYCSVITANLVKTKLYVPSEYVRPLAMEEEHVIENVKVTFLDANQ
ncbi:DNA cross-link repair 1A protein [Holothuria leucospilota]|uniref:DNA cross-link repair 1A protein n=1 Tax=Holothuria leucospilota TaxID=206669 RepID=A0A9Q0YPK7_HOLLE|nr:DNA cross-link repair 1A protein [Holothuria leucospilota]